MTRALRRPSGRAAALVRAHRCWEPSSSSRPAASPRTRATRKSGRGSFPTSSAAGSSICGAVLAWHALSGGWRNVPLDQEGHDAAGLVRVRHHQRRYRPPHGDHRLGRIHHRIHAAVRADRAWLRQPAAGARRRHRASCWPSPCSSSSRRASASACPRVRSGSRDGNVRRVAGGLRRCADAQESAVGLRRRDARHGHRRAARRRVRR